MARERLAGMIGFSTSKLAREVGVKLPTIRYYERRGVLPKPPRTAAGYRVFDSHAVARLRFIKHAQSLGFTLREIQGLLALRVDSDNTCGDVRIRAQAKVRDVEQKIRHLQEIRDAINRLIGACQGRRPSGECPLLEALAAPALSVTHSKSRRNNGTRRHSRSS